jgi:hypothetical protein
MRLKRRNKMFDFENLMSLLLVIFVIIFIGGNINNKLYDIREHMSGTCIRVSNFNGICK